MKRAITCLLFIFEIILLASYYRGQQVRPPRPLLIGNSKDNPIDKAGDTSKEWLLHGRNYYEDRYSPLEQISRENIGKLGLAWSLNLGTKRGIEATPLVVNGIMYLAGPWSLVYAIDVTSGKLVWKYDPKVPGSYGEKACCDVVNRGVALYKGLVYVGTLDGRLVAIDSKTGSER